MNHQLPISRTAESDRGATLIEAMIVVPVVLLFVLGLLEFGLASSDWLATGNATRSAGREASVSGSALTADHAILQAVRESAAAIPRGAIQEIVVFEASGPDATVPTACLIGPQHGLCNVYTAEHLSWDREEFGCDPALNPVADPDRFWCPSTRNDALSGPPDYVGVHLVVRHDFVTGLFGDAITLDESSVFRIEPVKR